MPTIHYVVLSNGGITGGQKMAIRHVEALRSLGFNADCYVPNKAPGQLDYNVPLVRGAIARDDILVVPDDSAPVLNQCAEKGWRTIVFAQNPFYMAAQGLDALDALGRRAPLSFLAVSEGLSATLKRLYPAAGVEIVRCFADERAFRPAAAKRPQIALTPRKRPTEAKAIAALFQRLHPQHGHFAWVPIQNASEQVAASAFGEASVFLSLSRLESVGMTTLEAMASGCLCAGFVGVGGAEYANPENGFWAPEDDCEAAVEALAQACALATRGGREYDQRIEAGLETARKWSYASFRAQLEETWMRLAPEARLTSGPLD